MNNSEREKLKKGKMYYGTHTLSHIYEPLIKMQVFKILCLSV